MAKRESWGELPPDIEHELERFHARLPNWPGDGEPPSKNECLWRRVLVQVAANFRDHLGEDDSYSLSVATICECYRGGRSVDEHERYLLKACRRAHVRLLRPRRKKPRFVQLRPDFDVVDERSTDQKEAWSDALHERVLPRMEPELAEVIRMKLKGLTVVEIARQLGLPTWQAEHLVTKAREQARQIFKGFER